jgi:hypothetical protein
VALRSVQTMFQCVKQARVYFTLPRTPGSIILEAALKNRFENTLTS